MTNLRDLDQAYQEAEDVIFEALPDGTYQTQVERVSFENSKRSGDLMLKWELSVKQPAEFENRRIFRYHILKPDTMVWFKQDMARIGMKLTKISELETKMDQLLDKFVDVKLSSKRNATGELTQYCNFMRSGDNYASATDDVPW